MEDQLGSLLNSTHGKGGLDLGTQIQDSVTWGVLTEK
jgi:hypothetical protein